MSQQIEPEQALQILSDTTRKIHTDLDGHTILQNCLMTLASIVQGHRELAALVESLKQERNDWREKAEALRAALESPQSEPVRSRPDGAPSEQSAL